MGGGGVGQVARPPQYSLKVADAAMASGAPDMALRVTELILQRDPDSVPAMIAAGNGGHVVNVAMTRPDLLRCWATDVIGVFDPEYEWHDLAQGWQVPGEGERAVGRAVAPFGTYFGISTIGTVSIEEIGRTVATPKLFQLYVHRDDGLNRALIERCKEAGFDAIALTVDTDGLNPSASIEAHSSSRSAPPS